MRAYAERLRHRSQTKGTLAYSFARTLEALEAWHQDQPEQALGALDEARLGGAALDVFALEPAPADGLAEK